MSWVVSDGRRSEALQPRGSGACARGGRGRRRCSVPRRYVTRARPRLAPTRESARASAACGRKTAADGGPRPPSLPSEVFEGALRASAATDSPTRKPLAAAAARRMFVHAPTSFSHRLLLKKYIRCADARVVFYMN